MKKMEGRRRKKRRKEGGRDREERRERREKKENSYRQQIKILAPKQELLCWLQSADPPAEDNELSNGTLSTVGCPCPLWGVPAHCGVSLSIVGCPSETLTRVNSTWVLRITCKMHLWAFYKPVQYVTCKICFAASYEEILWPRWWIQEAYSALFLSWTIWRTKNCTGFRGHMKSYLNWEHLTVGYGIWCIYIQ